MTPQIKKSLHRLLIYVTVITLVLTYENAALAIPSFGTLMPKKGLWQAGARTDFIFDRNIEGYKTASSASYCYSASYGFADWLCFDGVIGMGDVEAERDNNNELRYGTGFSGGYGFRAGLYKNDKYGAQWVCGFQHVSTHPQKRRHVEGRKYEIIWDEWQCSTAISKDIWRFRPYCGMKWSFTYLIDKISGDSHRRLSDGPMLGIIAGTDVRINEYLYVNAEGRFVDETALNAGFTVRFD